VTIPSSAGSSPATLWIAVASTASSKPSGGSTLGRSRASIVLPKLEYKGHEVVCDGRTVEVRKNLEIWEPRADRGSRWAARVQPEAPLCACGCGRAVELKGRHRSKGAPRYAHGHHPNPIRRAYDKLCSQGYRLVADVCLELGVSPTTLRRLEVRGVLPRARRLEFLDGRSVRAFSDSDVRGARRALAKWRLRDTAINPVESAAGKAP
jgi:hypothetical protein